MSVTHIVSKPVTIEGRRIQRCGWCGEKLLDSKGVMVPESMSEHSFPTWPENAFVQIDGNRQSVIETDEPNLLPPDHCMELAE